MWQWGRSISRLSWCGIRGKRLLFHSGAQTRLQWEKLMAMINDKGPEESRDTDATYIILSHQSVHLPRPSRQSGGREKEEEEKWKRRRQGRSETERDKKQKNEKRRTNERVIYSVFYTQELLLSSWGESGRKKKNKWQRGDKVNKKMACKISRRYSAREEESSLWSFLISSNLTLHVPKPHFQGLICHMVFPVWMIY